MNMDEKTINEALLKGEHVTLECKQSKAQVSEGVSNRVPNGVSDTAKAIYSHIKADPNISRNELVKFTGISLKNVQKHINRLKELGLIRCVGSTRLGYWEIIE